MPTKKIYKPLAQSRPATTSATKVYSPATDVVGIIKTIIVCNVTANDATYRIFLDIDSTTYDADTALGYDHAIPGNRTIVWDVEIPMDEDSNLAVRTGTASSLTFTIFGEEVTD